MNRRLLLIASAAAVALPTLASAQFPPPPPPPGSPAPAQGAPAQPGPGSVQDRWPSMPPPAQQRAPAEAAQSAPAEAAKPKPVAGPGHAVTCNGVFGRDSTHLKIAIKYDSRNVTYGPVDGPDGTKLQATVLFPSDPRRRLEVMWNNEAARADTSLIAINGKSIWTAPKGLKLGMPLAALEKANGRPFSLSGFGPDGTASVTGWQGGALASLPGGCKVGIRLAADGKAAPDALAAVAGDKTLLSNEGSLKAVKATVGEILIGY